jgi:RNA polymerase sigma factor (sigma-70 family)
VDQGMKCYERYLSGDETGLNDLVELYGDHLMMFINGYVRNLSTAEDLMEDVFVELLIDKNRFRGGSRFRTWLFQIGKNKALNYLKRENRYRMVDVEAVEADLAHEARIVEALFQDDQKRVLHTALGRIRRNYAQALYLIYFEEMTYAQAAEVLGQTVKQVDNMVSRGKKQLRIEMESLSGGSET